jgi:hypothetical protein
MGLDLDGGGERGCRPAHRSAESACGAVAGHLYRGRPPRPALEDPPPCRAGQRSAVHLGRRRDQRHGSSVGRRQPPWAVAASSRRPDQRPRRRRLLRARRLASCPRAEMSTALGVRSGPAPAAHCSLTRRPDRDAGIRPPPGVVVDLLQRTPGHGHLAQPRHRSPPAEWHQEHRSRPTPQRPRPAPPPQHPRTHMSTKRTSPDYAEAPVRPVAT